MTNPNPLTPTARGEASGCVVACESGDPNHYLRLLPTGTQHGSGVVLLLTRLDSVRLSPRTARILAKSLMAQAHFIENAPYTNNEGPTT